MAQLVKKKKKHQTSKKKEKTKETKKQKKADETKEKKKKNLLKKPESIFEIKKLNLDKRVHIHFSEFNKRAMDGFFSTKKKKKQLNLNKYIRSDHNTLSTDGVIPYMDISYVVLEMYEGPEFPNLFAIKDPFKKYDPAFTVVGSETDKMKKEVQERDLETIFSDLPTTERKVICYRIRRRNYERLIHAIMWEAVPYFINQTIPSNIKGSSILYPMQASNYGNKNFFHYLIGGHVMLKNGECYKLYEMDNGFDVYIANHMKQIDSTAKED